ncbi:MAG TPA: HD-GYP domain-containing protein [Solirubrobacterales bacterium]|jgi:putative nucleotidyltransferase with HDIG domain|nr:HD-GYP domain-containing protein [Solirubrobacterales bacterium]
MGTQSTSGSTQRLSRVLATTLAVVGIPVLVVSLLNASGTVTSLVLLLAIGTVLSIAASRAGAAFWASRTGAGDTVFGDLMLWGWLRRRRQERQLSSALALLGRQGDGEGAGAHEVSVRRRARLFEQLASALEARDPDTHNHSRRVARHAAAIAKRMGLSGEEVARIRTAGAVHDVGKIETPREIIDKPGALSDEEFAVIKRHAVVGAEMVAGLEDPELTRIVRHHHERLDGAGYPDGLSGEEIPLGARIIAVADTFDALTSARPYRPAKRHREALDLLAAEAGTQLDPDAVRAFRGYYSGLRSVVFWVFALNGPRQLLTWLAAELRLDGAAVTAKVVAATAVTTATLAAGSAVVHSTHGHPEGHRTAVTRQAPHGGGASAPSAGAPPQAATGNHGGHETDAGESRPPPVSAEAPSSEIGSEAHGESPSESESPASETASPDPTTDKEFTDEGESATGASGAATTPVKVVATSPELPAPVGAVVETVESGSVDVNVPGVPETQVNVPGLPSVTVGGK